MNQKRLRLEHIRKSHGSHVVFDDLTIEIHPGEFLVVLGPSGCGKTTLLNIVAGLEDISRGSVVIGDQDVTGLDPGERNIAMVFQSLSLYPTMTARRNIGFALKVAGMDRREVAQRVDDVARRLKIVPLLERRPAQLSGGERQRVAIGRALVRNPAVMLLDEPLSNLDSHLRAELRTELKRLHAEQPRTTLYVTHDQVEAMTLGSRIAVLDRGRIQQCAPPQLVYDKPANLTVARLLGAYGIQFIKGRLLCADGTPRLCGRDGAVLPLQGIELGCNVHNGDQVLLGIRPEYVRIADGAPQAGIAGLVTAQEMTGGDTYLSIDLPCGQVTARVSPEEGSRAGPQVSIRIETRRISLFDPVDGKRLN
jgi:multiple sugar transport system ATP-binding protein